MKSHFLHHLNKGRIMVLPYIRQHGCGIDECFLKVECITVGADCVQLYNIRGFDCWKETSGVYTPWRNFHMNLNLLDYEVEQRWSNFAPYQYWWKLDKTARQPGIETMVRQKLADAYSNPAAYISNPSI